MELAAPTIAEGIESCIKRGATAIAIMPILLLAAQHAKHDIPLEIDKAKIQYPTVKFTYGEPLGVHELLIDTLHARILATRSLTDQASVLLIGRGSSDPAVQLVLAKIATRLRDKYAYVAVDTCFYMELVRALKSGCSKSKITTTVYLLCLIYYLQAYYIRVLRSV